jgi:UDP-N-acetylmuramate dehydrogenase
VLAKQLNFSLRDFNTFGIAAVCKELYIINSLEDLTDLPKDRTYKVLGGGSNVLCNDYIDASLIKIEIPGIEVVTQDDKTIDLEVGAGVVWHDLVQYAVSEGYGGLENLTLIPGTVGAAPVQNVGAYGVEQDQLMVSLRAYDLQTREAVSMSREDRQFGYRDSRFKSREKGRYVITHVTYRLSKVDHVIKTTYGAILDKLAEMDVTEPTIADVSRAVAAIRTFKLPDPREVPNAGSFFKNPVIPKPQFDDLLGERPDLVYYPLADDLYKVPAGWLIDQCGYRGKQVGNVGCYKNQALVIVNHGGATGAEIRAFSREIQRTVLDKFGIHLIPEVNHWGF